MSAGVAGLTRSSASRSDPPGPQRAEPFWNSLSHGLRPCYFGQFQLSFPLRPRRVPRSSGEFRSHPGHTLSL
jgi:hypothetical protein